MQNSETENRGPEGTQLCKYCQRRVKEFNMPRHEENCTKAPKPCVYCDRMFLPDKMPMHHKECDQNPGNVPECNSAAPEPGVVTDPPEANRTDETVCVTSHDINTGDGTTWLYQLDLGDWLGAFVAMEESFKTKTLNQYARYAYFTQEFHCLSGSTYRKTCGLEDRK
ncbi:hypothetical protein MTO96_018694 [Rhipicephalus appendiculatus]